MLNYQRVIVAEIPSRTIQYSTKPPPGPTDSCARAQRRRASWDERRPGMAQNEWGKNQQNNGKTHRNTWENEGLVVVFTVVDTGI